MRRTLARWGERILTEASNASLPTFPASAILADMYEDPLFAPKEEVEEVLLGGLTWFTLNFNIYGSHIQEILAHVNQSRQALSEFLPRARAYHSGLGHFWETLVTRMAGPWPDIRAHFDRHPIPAAGMSREKYKQMVVEWTRERREAEETWYENLDRAALAESILASSRDVRVGIGRILGELNESRTHLELLEKGYEPVNAWLDMLERDCHRLLDIEKRSNELDIELWSLAMRVHKQDERLKKWKNKTWDKRQEQQRQEISYYYYWVDTHELFYTIMAWLDRLDRESLSARELWRRQKLPHGPEVGFHPYPDPFSREEDEEEREMTRAIEEILRKRREREEREARAREKRAQEEARRPRIIPSWLWHAFERFRGGGI